MSKKAKPDAPVVEAAAEEAPAVSVRHLHKETIALLEAAEDGSSFVKERGAWRVTFVQNGHALACAGPSIPEAVETIGGVKTHDSLGNVI